MKFKIGDKAIVSCDVGYTRIKFLKHFQEKGTEVEIAGLFTGWKGHEAYNIKGSSEIFLAEELEPLIIKNKK